MLLNVFSLVVVLGVLVLLHEGGHFLIARALSARVSVFSLGFGKRLFGAERGGTDYRVSLIPLGGYVRIHGLGPDESDVVGKEAAAPEPLLPRWRRSLILLAGPAANIVGAVLFVTLAFVVGMQVPASEDRRPDVARVHPGHIRPAISCSPSTANLWKPGASSTWRRSARRVTRSSSGSGGRARSARRR